MHYLFRTLQLWIFWSVEIFLNFSSFWRKKSAIELFNRILKKKAHQHDRTFPYNFEKGSSKGSLKKNKMNYKIVQLSTDSQYSWSVALNSWVIIEIGESMCLEGSFCMKRIQWPRINLSLTVQVLNEKKRILRFHAWDCNRLPQGLLELQVYWSTSSTQNIHIPDCCYNYLQLL